MPFRHHATVRVRRDGVWSTGCHRSHLWGRFVEHQHLSTLLRCHLEAFAHVVAARERGGLENSDSSLSGEAEA